MRLGNIIIDTRYQTRMKTDSTVASRYAKAMLEGSIFPPMVIEKGTNKVVDGFTRMEAYMRAFRPDTDVPVTMKTFKNELDRLINGCPDNFKHGTRYDSFTMSNLLCRMGTAGATKKDVPEISKMIGWNKDRVLEGFGIALIKIGNKTAPNSKPNSKPEPSSIGEETIGSYVIVKKELKPLKNGLKHLENTVMLPDTYQAMLDHHTGWNDVSVINQILLRIDNNFLNLGDTNTTEKLKELHTKLSVVVDGLKSLKS